MNEPCRFGEVPRSPASASLACFEMPVPDHRRDSSSAVPCRPQPLPARWTGDCPPSHRRSPGPRPAPATTFQPGPGFEMPVLICPSRPATAAPTTKPPAPPGYSLRENVDLSICPDGTVLREVSSGHPAGFWVAFQPGRPARARAPLPPRRAVLRARFRGAVRLHGSTS